ncbi:MAG: 8-oxo-dGTP diphosphatase [Thermoanaerobacterium sp.]|nr:8-oxo-dGTP diphosphatase [Thermoanaerobacterium sp.]MDN5317625.1 8-oxo-dGTP diphosphatase [Thermoanaerobacterium sp.]
MGNLRACLLVSRAVIINDNKVLLVKHQVENEIGWVFPGGRVEENESTVDALIRECKEETGYDIIADSVCYLEEYSIYYATYFRCSIVGGDLRLGFDPDMPEDKQVIKDVKWVDISEFDKYDIYPEGLKEMIKDGSINSLSIRIPKIYR